MKNIFKVFIVFSLIMLSADIFASTVRLKMNHQGGGGRYHLFTGFPFFEYAPSKTGLELIVDNEYKHIKENDDASVGNSEYYTAVGYSQGGLRALSHATYLKQYDPAAYNKLQAAITVSGIAKGAKLLEGGVSATSARLHKISNTIYGGFRAWYKLFTNPFLEITESLGVTKIDIRIKKNVESFVINTFLPDFAKPYFIPIWENKPDTLGEIRDMVPRSAFIDNNLSKNTTHYKKVKTGTKSEWKFVSKTKTVFGVKIKYLTYAKVTVPVYKIYESYQDTLKFGDELPVGYIVGERKWTGSLFSEKQLEKISKITKDLCSKFITANQLHILKNIFFIGLLSNSSKYAKDAAEADEWLWDIWLNLQKLMYCQNGGDGLIAKESQFYPKKFTNPNTNVETIVHNNVLGKRDIGYLSMPDENHITIAPDKNEKVQGHIADMIRESFEPNKRIR